MVPPVSVVLKTFKTIDFSVEYLLVDYTSDRLSPHAAGLLSMSKHDRLLLFVNGPRSAMPMPVMPPPQVRIQAKRYRTYLRSCRHRVSAAIPSAAKHPIELVIFVAINLNG
jgi:hypothetical protein